MWGFQPGHFKCGVSLTPTIFSISPQCLTWILVEPCRPLSSPKSPQIKKVKKSGEAGYRSPCLMHAKHALYHLSYIPVSIQEEIVNNSKKTVIVHVCVVGGGGRRRRRCCAPSLSTTCTVSTISTVSTVTISTVRTEYSEDSE
jgi:hypothetical protein